MKYVHCNDVEENKLLQKQANEVWKLNITFEFTAQATPQHNNLA